MSSADTLPEARTWTKRQVAARLGVCPNTFKARLPGLYEEGFPAPLPGLNRWDIAKVEAWLDSGGRVSNHVPSQADRDLDGWQP